MHRRTAALLVVAAIVAVLLFERSSSRPQAAIPSPAGKLSVVASFYPLYFLAQQIGGDKASVANVTPAGAEPHDYEPTARDIAGIEDSGLLIIDGRGLEAWSDRVRKNLDPAKTVVVVAGEGFMTRQVEEEGKTIVDPHVWLSPPLVAQMADRIAAGFAKADAPNAAYYRENADALKAKLETLDAEYRRGLADCARKDFITSHAAFGYLAASYGLTQVAITGISPDAEPSSKALAEIAKFAKDNGVKYVFFESLVSPKLSDTIAKEIGAKTLVLDPIEGIIPEELAAGRDYLSVMRDNLANLQIALQCRT